MSSRATSLVGAILYGLFVFLGATSLGFAVLPTLGHATGLDTETEEAFSFLTLEAVPLLGGLSAAAALSYQWLTRLSLPRRVAVYCATSVLAWLMGAATAAVVLG